MNRIGQVLSAGAGVAGLAVASRGLGYEEVNVSSLEVPVSLVWLLLAGATLAHIFWTAFTVGALQNLVSDWESPGEPADLYDEITTSSNWFVQGMVPRTGAKRPGSRLVGMSWKDPSAWIALALAILTAAAVLPWHIDDGLQWEKAQTVATYSGVAVVLIVLNWWAGGLWAIGISRITTPEGAARFTIFEGSSLFASEADGSRSALIFFAAIAVLGAAIAGVVMLIN